MASTVHPKVQQRLGMIAVALGASLACSAALAEVSTIETQGEWSLGFGTDVSGTRVCSASTFGTDIYMGVKVYDRNDHITVQFAKKGWRIPSGTRARIAFQFDRAAPWTGTGFSANNQQVIETLIPIKEIKSFSNQFRYASRLSIVFPDGNERPWRIGLRGSRYIMDRLANCVALLTGGGGGRDTQPFSGGGGATQPFQSGPAPAPPAPPAEDRVPATPLPAGDRV